MKHTLYHNFRKIVIFIMHDKKLKQPEHSLQKNSSCGKSSVKIAHALLFWEYSSRRSGNAGSSRGWKLFLVKNSIYFFVLKPPFHTKVFNKSRASNCWKITQMKHTLNHEIQRVVIYKTISYKVIQLENSLQKESSCGIFSVKMAHALLFCEPSTAKTSSAGSSWGCKLLFVKIHCIFS